MEGGKKLLEDKVRGGSTRLRSTRSPVPACGLQRCRNWPVRLKVAESGSTELHQYLEQSGYFVAPIDPYTWDGGHGGKMKKMGLHQYLGPQGYFLAPKDPYSWDGDHGGKMKNKGFTNTRHERTSYRLDGSLHWSWVSMAPMEALEW
jgi:hypothetical protein